MSVIMIMRVSGDAARFEETVAAQAEAIGRIMDVAKRNGLIAHRWYGSDGALKLPSRRRPPCRACARTSRSVASSRRPPP